MQIRIKIALKTASLAGCTYNPRIRRDQKGILGVSK